MNPAPFPVFNFAKLSPRSLDAEQAIERGRRASGLGEISSDETSARFDRVVHVGLDWGTSQSCVLVAPADSDQVALRAMIPSVVGYARDGIVEDVLPDNAVRMFGNEALEHRLHLRLVHPLAHGLIRHPEAARDFATFLRDRIDATQRAEIRAVIGMPSGASIEARQAIREAVKGLFHRVILVPKPFLAAIGCRDEARLREPSYVDPVRNSIFVDLGAGSTDVCLVQGCYPSAEEQVGIPFGGDRIDEMIRDGLTGAFPQTRFSLTQARELKEQLSFAGHLDQPAKAEILIEGRPRRVDFTPLIGQGCQLLVQHIFDAITHLVARAESESVRELVQNILLTGGGSQIRNIDRELQRLLAEAGFANPVVRKVGENFKDTVAVGALKAAQHARENQWQLLT